MHLIYNFETQFYSYNITGDKIPHDPFTDGAEQLVLFGNCSI